MLLQHNLFFNTALYVCHKVNIPIKGKDFKQQILKSSQEQTECLLTPSLLQNGGGGERSIQQVPLCWKSRPMGYGRWWPFGCSIAFEREEEKIPKKACFLKYLD